MDAELLMRYKQILSDLITEIVIWRLPSPLPGCGHSYKYRLFFGKMDGTCFVRYDNEKGKGDHRHQADAESPYPFRDLGSLLADFMNDINNL
jgi:hypothetical protein